TTGSEEALINNLDLKVTAPDSTVYWGNNGLFNNLWSASGTGLNHWTQSSGYRDDLNNVENVFVQSPQTGNWMIEVFGRTGDLPDGPQNFSLIASGASNIVPSTTVDFPTVPDTILSGLVDVLWTATDVEDGTDLDIMIQYSPDGGSSWITLETSPFGPPYNNDGIYSWDATTVSDGVNYLIKVEATDSVGMVGSDISDTPFSIDNMPIAPPGPEAEWFFQIQATGPNMDLDMKPVELTPNSVQSADLSAAGQYLIGTWESIEALTGANINGPWTFNVYGYTTDPGAMVGYLYGKIFTSSDLVMPLDTMILDNKNVGAYPSSHLFTWTDSLSGNIPDGDSLIVEIWLDVSTGNGGPGSTIYNYVGVTQAGGPHDAYFYDCNAMSSTGPDMGLGPPANEIYELTDTEYGNVSTSDDVWAISVDPGAFDETFTWCDVQVAEDLATITQISMTFEGQAATATDFQIWAFNLATATWGQIGTAVSVGANTDIAFTRSITANCADYISGTGLLTWGCYQTDSSDLIRVDYLEATITYFQPYPNFVMEFDYGDTQSNVVPYINTGPPPTYDIDLTGVAVDTWVFVSFPITAIGDVPTVFNDTSWGDGGTTWDYIQWYDNSAREWKSYATYKPASVNDMDIIDNAAGFWIHITANGGNQKLTVGTGVMPAGPVFINLYTGWNLVGYPSATPRTADIALLGTSADVIAVYNATAPYRITDVPSIQFNTVTMLEGNAYWVHVTTDTTWTVGL
ncbi:MAG: hypothetical protein KAX31_01900, partial [Thermoplasmata archaeon]|nr:hypothetical protein [Thermoplasmata archaeon]